MNKLTLKECCSFQEGYVNPPQEYREYFGGDIKWLRASDLNDAEVYSTERTLSDKGFKSAGKSALLFKEDTIAISKSGTIGKLGILRDRMCGNRAVINIDVNTQKVDLYYVFYTLMYKKPEIVSKAGGSIQKNLYVSALETITLNHKAKDQQAKISRILSAIDKKIALNNKINTELEAMAKLIYDYWFVQFDFPNANGNPYKSSGGKMVYNEALNREIPKGWKGLSLSEIAEISNNSVNPANHADQVFKLFSIPTFDATKTYGLDLGRDIGSNKFVVADEHILVSKLNPWFNRVVYTIDESDQICSTEFVVWCSSSAEMKNYLYMIATSQQFIAFCTQSATGTSNSHKRVNPKVMMNFKLAFNQEVAESLGGILEPILKKIIKNNNEISRLAELRDWLLPMLMNGQVTVKGCVS